MAIGTSDASAADRWSGWKPYEVRYLNLYDQSAKADLDVGANRVDDALPDRLRRAQVERLSGRLDAWLHPPAPEPVVVEPSAPAPLSYGTSGACGGVTPYAGGGACWAIPYEIVLCESGGDYSAYNPSGASGAYQLMIGGGGSPAEQDAAAAALWNGGAGRSNWVC